MAQTAEACIPMPNVKYVRGMARELKVKNYSRMRKDQLIWSVQEAEGNAACYKKIGDCGIMDCLFRGECQAQ